MEPVMRQSRDEQDKATSELTDYRERGMNDMGRTQKGQEGHQAAARSVTRRGVAWRVTACYFTL